MWVGEIKLKYDEKRILDDIKHGKQSIEVNIFFDDCGGRLLHFFKWEFQMSHQDIEDALQEAAIKFIKSIRDNKFRGDCSLYAYLSVITKNECINIFRKRKSIPEGMEEFCPEFLDCQMCISEVLDDFEKVEQNAVERLKVIRLWFEGCSIKEMAGEIIRSEGATKKFLFECRKKLKTYLKKCLSECNHELIRPNTEEYRILPNAYQMKVLLVDNKALSVDALWAELEYRQQPVKLNPQILQRAFEENFNKPSVWQKLYGLVPQLSNWKSLSVATSILAVMVILFMPPEPVVKNPLGLQVKGSVVPQSLMVSEPQVTAQNLQLDLAKLGIVANVKNTDYGWLVEVANLSTDNPEDLFVLLQNYKLNLPSPGENGFVVRVVENDG